jgi:restriction endonuclease
MKHSRGDSFLVAALEAARTAESEMRQILLQAPTEELAQAMDTLQHGVASLLIMQSCSRNLADPLRAVSAIQLRASALALDMTYWPWRDIRSEFLSIRAYTDAVFRIPVDSYAYRSALTTMFKIAGGLRAVRPIIETYNMRLVDRLGPNPEDWLRLSPRQFEEVLADLWRGLGWHTILTPPSGDGGFDIRAVRNEAGISICYLLEAKRYSPDQPVGVEVVRHLFGVVERERASHGIVVTTSRFTHGARVIARELQYRLSLADFGKVLEWLVVYRTSSKGESR